MQVEGSGPDIILIPGLASSRTVWSELANRLRDNYRLHLVQISGFAGAPNPGTTDGKVAAPAAEAIADYILREKLQAPTVIGHSLGGEVGLMLAARHDGLTGRLMVVDALPFYSLLMNPAATVDSVTPQAAAFRDGLMTASDAQADAMQAAAIARLVKTEDARASVIEASLASDRKTVANATYELMTTDLRDELGRISSLSKWSMLMTPSTAFLPTRSTLRSVAPTQGRPLRNSPASMTASTSSCSINLKSSRRLFGFS